MVCSFLSFFPVKGHIVARLVPSHPKQLQVQVTKRGRRGEGSTYTAAAVDDDDDDDDW